MTNAAPHQCHFTQAFKNHFILNQFCPNTLTILVLFFQIFLIVEFMKPNSKHRSASFFHFNFSLMLKTFLLFLTVAIFSLHQSPCWSRKIEGNVKQLPQLLSFSRPGIYIATWKNSRLALSRTRRWLNSQSSLLLGKLYWNQWLVMLLHQR